MENIFGSTSPTEMLWFTILAPCCIEFQCALCFGGPDYTISSGHRSRIKGHSLYKKVCFLAQIVGSNPIVHCRVS